MKRKKNLILKLSNVLGRMMHLMMHFAITISRHEKEKNHNLRP